MANLQRKMRLFKVPIHKRVRLTSKIIRWKISDKVEEEIAKNVTWEGTTTDRYKVYDGKLRRLIIKPSVDFFRSKEIWQVDTDCEVLD